jgi:hypothetical protein
LRRSTCYSELQTQMNVTATDICCPERRVGEEVRSRRQSHRTRRSPETRRGCLLHCPCQSAQVGKEANAAPSQPRRTDGHWTTKQSAGVGPFAQGAHHRHYRRRPDWYVEKRLRPRLQHMGPAHGRRGRRQNSRSAQQGYLFNARRRTCH